LPETDILRPVEQPLQQRLLIARQPGRRQIHRGDLPVGTVVFDRFDRDATARGQVHHSGGEVRERHPADQNNPELRRPQSARRRVLSPGRSHEGTLGGYGGKVTEPLIGLGL
jgi:hypothetical protein